jgi:hypothetical protein
VTGLANDQRRPESGPALVSEEVITPDDDGCITQADLLKAFDRRRRHLAQLVARDDGLFAGYDVLEMPAMLGTGGVRVSATVRDDVGSRHAVEYIAVLMKPEEASLPSAYFVAEIAKREARATGWTLVPSRR